MTQHPALQPGRVAVITGGANGIGLAAGKRFAELGLDVLLADADEAALQTARGEVSAAGPGRVETALIDVSSFEEIESLKQRAFDVFGDVAVLMNNAGIGGGGGPMNNRERWLRVLSVNFLGVLNGVQAFGPAMIDQGKPALIINTGSKQGITTPPGDTAYNVSKAGIRVLTEGLQHALRNTAGCQVSAHLLVPGSTFTGMTARGRTDKPPGAWTALQVADFMLERLAAGDFYILCPDNEVTREMDNARMDWATDDLILNRPPLSRWHPDYAEAFKAFLAERTGHG